ncbi:hypothetical protein TanjilG_14646 [Lupinus angustifolius]|uniref:Uncharacterized protein n=1 Tax=Lupinus angustifolius TaxID=3871 RepID=A0A1J7HZM5_LUPAN|nr:hypothetical protein TanjilG_14646 [Lupinus angustifolius]
MPIAVWILRDGMFVISLLCYVVNIEIEMDLKDGMREKHSPSCLQVLVTIT